MHQPEDSGLPPKKTDEELQDLLNSQYFSVDLNSMKDLNNTIKDMLFGPQIDDTLYKQINAFTDAIFASWGGGEVDGGGIIFVGKNSFGESVYKPSHFVVDELKTEYLNHIRQHSAHTLSQPNYYNNLFEILN